MTFLAALLTLYFLVNVTLPERYLAYGVIGPMTLRDCRMLTTSEKPCVPLHIPKGNKQ